MATNQTETPEQGERLDIVASGTLYRFIEAPNPHDMHEQLAARLAQLDAMMSMARSGMGEDESAENSTLEAYFWNCQTIVQECKQLAGHLAEACISQRTV